jgi:enterochelin esterase-like enzyme
MAWMNPKSFSKVLSISGSYTNLEYPYNPRYPEGGWTYTTGLLGQAGSQTAPIKVWMNAGTQDLNWSAAGPYLNWTIANENMAQALSAGGYDYHFDLVLNGGHGSGPAQLETLPEALIWLWAGYH